MVFVVTHMFLSIPFCLHFGTAVAHICVHTSASYSLHPLISGLYKRKPLACCIKVMLLPSSILEFTPFAKL